MPTEAVRLHRASMTVSLIDPDPFSAPGLLNQSLRIPMAFTACSLRVHWAVFPSRLLKYFPFTATVKIAY
jgi:hypothetical protein